jgi:hypothetical protein
MLTSNAVVALENPAGASLLNLPLFPSGYKSAISRIPEQRGVYAFFPYHNYPDDADQLYEVITRNVERKKFADRKANIAPYYGITLESKTSLSAGKTAKIKKALKNEIFRKDLLEMLGNTMLFQSPLYLGKAKNLNKRIENHLEYGSALRERLDVAGYNIEDTSIVIIPSTQNPEEVEDEDIDSEGIAEEIFSRLFQIQFTLRLG